jgi:sugar phosphate isomerase/epimerase
MDGRQMDRRSALRMLGGTFAGAAGLCLLPSAARGASAQGVTGPFALAGRRIERVGLQLYTVRKALAKDLEGTIAAIAAAGVRELEFAGYYEKSAVWWRTLLGRHGLTTPATHVGLPRTDAEWAPHFAFAKELEHTWVIVPWLGNADRVDVASWRRVADRLNRAGEMAKRAGVNLGYHNHDFEFARVGDTTGFEILMAHTDPALVDFELDLYWAVRAGQDPIAMMSRWNGRFTCCHVKDAGPPPARTMLDVGAGTIDFEGILDAGRAQGLRHWFIEHDNPADPMASVRASALAMQQL